MQRKNVLSESNTQDTYYFPNIPFLPNASDLKREPTPNFLPARVMKKQNKQSASRKTNCVSISRCRVCCVVFNLQLNKCTHSQWVGVQTVGRGVSPLSANNLGTIIWWAANEDMQAVLSLGLKWSQRLVSSPSRTQRSEKRKVCKRAPSPATYFQKESRRKLNNNKAGDGGARTTKAAGCASWHFEFWAKANLEAVELYCVYALQSRLRLRIILPNLKWHTAFGMRAFCFLQETETWRGMRTRRQSPSILPSGYSQNHPHLHSAWVRITKKKCIILFLIPSDRTHKRFGFVGWNCVTIRLGKIAQA